MAKKINELDPAVVTDPADVLFAVDQTDLAATRNISLADIQAYGATAVVDAVADLATATPADGQLWQTRGYTTVGDGGANLYRYDVASAVTVDGGWVINGPSSVGRYLALDTSVANVKQFGAVGDGVADDTAAIQAAISAVYAVSAAVGKGAAVYVPTGRYMVATTIDFGNLRGFKLYGDGSHSFDSDPSSSFPQSLSCIVWNGAAGGTVMKTSGAYFTIRDLAIWGAGPGDATFAGVGFQLSKAAGIASGNGSFVNTAIVNCDIGFKCATNAADENCENMVWDQAMFHTCGIAYQVNNAQGAGHTFGFVQSLFCGNVFDFNAGGQLVVDHLFCYQVDEVLRIDGDGTATGETQGSFTFNSIQIDGGGQTVTPEIVVVGLAGGGGGNRLIKINNLRMGSASHKADGRFLFDLAGSAYLHVEDIMHLNVANSILRLDGSGTYKPKALIERGVITATSIPAGWVGAPTFVTQTGSGTLWGFKNCRTYFLFDKLPDIGSFEDLDVRIGSQRTATSGDTTPEVGGVGILVTANATPTTISNFDGGVNGQQLVVLINDANTTIDFTVTALKGNNGADWTPTTGDHMTCTRIGGAWYCNVSDNTA
jgi:hypothetical protein